MSDQSTRTFALAICLACFFGGVMLGIFSTSAVRAQEKNKSAAYVKVSAVARKPDASGRQELDITLDIDKSCYLLANPTGNEILEYAKTKVGVMVTGKPAEVEFTYPPGKTMKVAQERFDVYQGKVVIHGMVKRIVNDTSPMEVLVNMQAQFVVYKY